MAAPTRARVPWPASPWSWVRALFVLLALVCALALLLSVGTGSERVWAGLGILFAALAAAVG